VTIGRTWIDLTDLVAWDGRRPTGIPRVTRNLLARYAARSDVGFFAFADATMAFERVDLERVLAFASAEAPAVAPPRAHAQLPGPGRREMGGLRRWLPPPAKRVVRPLMRPVRDLWSWLNRRNRGPAPANAAVEFNRGDRVLVLGAAWVSDGLQVALREQQRINGIRVYQLIFDLAPVLLPQCFSSALPERFTRYLVDATAISDGLIAISANTRSDVLRFCEDRGIPPPPIEVVRLGDEIAGERHVAPVEGLDGRRFILSVGTFEARKNYQLLYQVWTLALDRGLALPDLVIVGKLGSAAADTQRAITRDPRVRDSIHVLHEAGDDQLEWLYRDCLFTVYPSIYEGWGLPIAESLARGKLCLASSAAAMPEVAGSLIDYFSPYDAAECLSRIVDVLEPDRLAAKERQIREEYRPTSWDRAFQDFEAALVRLQDADRQAAR
jgi:glycosyltransferase involved in cell wall biosynthesis